MGGTIALTKTNYKEGVLLVATGNKYCQEAIQSVQKIRPYLNGRPLTIVTDEPTERLKDLFDQVRIHPDIQYTYRDKIPPLLNLPYERTLFLDTDLELIEQIDDLFRMLETFDIIGCHAPVRWCQWNDPNVPEGFCEINSGVLGFRRSRRTHALIRRWLTTYDIAGVPFDQASLRAAMWWTSKHKGLRSWILPPEYNLRTPKPWLVGPGLKVKIIHGRVKDEVITPLKIYLNENVDSFRCSSAFPTGQNQQIKEQERPLEQKHNFN